MTRPNTYPKVLTFGRGKLAPLASGTGITIGCKCRIHIDQTASVREPAIAIVPLSPDKSVYNDRVQTYDEPPAAVRPRHALANWTSIRLGNDPNRLTVTEIATGQLIDNTVIDSTGPQNGDSRQQNRESDDEQSTEAELIYSDYSSEHLEDLV